MSIGFERLFFFLLMFLILVHIVTCIWIMQAHFFKLEDDNVKNGELYSETWMQPFVTDRIIDGVNIYFTSFYWCITTITTVGYGDISGTSAFERVFCSLVMIIGVVSFSFVNGAIASILSNYDVQNAVT